MYNQRGAHPHNGVFYRNGKFRICKYCLKILPSHIYHGAQSIPLKKAYIDQIAERENKKCHNQYTCRQEVQNSLPSFHNHPFLSEKAAASMIRQSRMRQPYKYLLLVFCCKLFYKFIRRNIIKRQALQK